MGKSTLGSEHPNLSVLGWWGRATWALSILLNFFSLAILPYVFLFLSLRSKKFQGNTARPKEVNSDMKKGSERKSCKSESRSRTVLGALVAVSPLPACGAMPANAGCFGLIKMCVSKDSLNSQWTEDTLSPNLVVEERTSRYVCGIIISVFSNLGFSFFFLRSSIKKPKGPVEGVCGSVGWRLGHWESRSRPYQDKERTFWIMWISVPCSPLTFHHGLSDWLNLSLIKNYPWGPHLRF